MKPEWKGLANSFKYAFRGIWHCVVSERNFRIHLVAAAYVAALAVLLEVDAEHFALLFLAISSVLVMEMLNTAIETLVDLASPHQHPLAKIAKDVAAGAVLVSACASVGGGFWLLWQPDKLVGLAAVCLESPALLTGLAVSVALAFLFVFAVKEKPK